MYMHVVSFIASESSGKAHSNIYLVWNLYMDGIFYNILQRGLRCPEILGHDPFGLISGKKKRWETEFVGDTDLVAPHASSLLGASLHLFVVSDLFGLL